MRRDDPFERACRSIWHTWFFMIAIAVALNSHGHVRMHDLVLLGLGWSAADLVTAVIISLVRYFRG